MPNPFNPFNWNSSGSAATEPATDLDLIHLSQATGNSGRDIGLFINENTLRRSGVARQITKVQGLGLVRAAQQEVNAALTSRKLDLEHALAKQQVDLDARLVQNKILAAGSIATTAQSEVALITQLESSLIQAVGGSPLAAARIDSIATIATTGIAAITGDGINGLRRI